MHSATPQIAVIVLCLKASPDVIGAVSSLLNQSEPAEILVINSGGGNVAALLGDAGLSVRSMEFTERLLVGAARNRGIAATSAPFVAFLASDCRAGPGWVENRLARHRRGVAAVSSAMINSHPDSLVASAAHISLFMRRLPGLPDELAIRFGVSFDRRLFADFGLFDETVQSGEDTEFLNRLPEEFRPAWAPEVQTVHCNETRFLPQLAAHFRRGLKYGEEEQRIFGKTRFKAARGVLRQARYGRRLARIGLSDPERRRAWMSLPILWMLLVAKAAGVLLSARQIRQEQSGK